MVHLRLALLALTTVPFHAQEVEKAPKTSATVEGSFVDREGHAVAGVHVLSRIWPGAEYAAESDANGRFEITLEWDSDRDGTWYECHARKKGYALSRVRADLRAEQVLDLGRLTLDPGGVLTGSVLDESGAPLPGTGLLVVNAAEHGPPSTEDQEEGPAWEIVTDHGTTDDTGEFEIIGVPPGQWYLAAKHESTWWRSSAAVDLEAGASTQVPPIRLRELPEEFRIEGRVLGPDQSPVADAVVSTSVLSPDESFMDEASAQTDEAGRFVLFLPRLPRDPIELSIAPPDDELDDGFMRSVRPGARDVLVRLGGTRVLRLHVIDDQGLPVEHYGWSLSIQRSDGYGVMTGSPPEFHEEGYASLRVPEHPFELEIESNSHNRKELGRFFPASLPEVLEVTLTRSAAISGYVTFEGRPVPGVFVELVQRTPNYLKGVVEGHWNGLYYGLESSTTHSDEKGRFHIPNDFPHLTYYARAWADGYSEGLSGPVKVGASDVHVELGVGGEVAGAIRLPRGLPPGGIELEFYREEFEANSINTSVGRIHRTTTMADGSYALAHLDPGTWLVRARPSGTLVSELGWSEAQVEAESHPYFVFVADRATTYLDAALGEDEMCVLEGRLTVGDRIREGYAQLLLEGPHALQLDFSGVDDEGRFQLVARKPGTYRLVIHAGPGHHQYEKVTDLVEFVPGTTVWERDLPVELWAGRGVRLDAH